jgi:hypothetical protein
LTEEGKEGDFLPEAFFGDEEAGICCFAERALGAWKKGNGKGMVINKFKMF